MKLFVLAFAVSIALHLLFFNNYVIPKDTPAQNKETQNKKSSIQFVKLKKLEPKVEPKKVIQKKIVEKVQTKEKPIIKKTVQSNKPKKVIKPKTKKTIVKKSIKKERKKTIAVNKKTIEKAAKLQDKILKDQIVDKKNSIQKKTLENFLSQAEPVDNKMLNEIMKLYGKEYESFTKVQKAFIEKNHNSFQVITQRVLNRLGYPRLARKLRLSGTNVVEFMFYPDGSIKNLKITKSSGYSVFDKYTLNLIEIAYKDYPRPKTPTKLKFYVRYMAY